MARVFISVLGTTDYQKCTYCFENKKGLPDVRFVQEAMIERFCRHWTTEDRILVFVTESAKKLNWEDNGHKDKQGVSLEREGLKIRLTRLRPTAPVETIDIPEGKSEKEIREIFQKLHANLNAGDEVIFDITHSFRSIPMLALVALHYSKVIKRVRLTGIYYGAFEVLGSQREVEQMPLEKRLAPVFDLTPFDNLLDWTVAIGVFLRSGNAALATQLAEHQAQRVLREKKGADLDAQHLRKVAGLLSIFSKDITTCRGLKITRDVGDLKRVIQESRNSCQDSPFSPLLELVEKSLEDFSGQDVMDGIRAAEWCAQHNLVQQGYTILRESLITYVCHKHGIDPTEREGRETVTDDIGADLKMLREYNRDSKQKKLGATPQRAFCSAVFGDNLELLRVYQRLFMVRNDINHAGMRKGAQPADTLIRELQELTKETNRLLFASDSDHIHGVGQP